MERVTKVLVVLAIFLMAFFASAEGGRDVPTKKEVDNPQNWNGGDGGSSWGGVEATGTAGEAPGEAGEATGEVGEAAGGFHGSRTSPGGGEVSTKLKMRSSMCLKEKNGLEKFLKSMVRLTTDIRDSDGHAFL
ncbi:hypothetical protein Acr_28g0008170 [Actinidia rufa]|uniref:Glycine-rich protein n=1 Tax=Actinidia rufa TaxID=165716 RepID=A0A7J0HAH3_9ERIC|nr:hypothetical protein Acr_28g0008170 [Actinidia rufa]